MRINREIKLKDVRWCDSCLCFNQKKEYEKPVCKLGYKYKSTWSVRPKKCIEENGL